MIHSTHPIHLPIPRVMTMAVVAAIFGGCSSDSGVTSPSSTSARTFDLSRIDGANLPYTIPNCSTGTVVTSARLRLLPDHSYTLSVLGSRGGASTELSSDEGTWANTGSSIQFSGGEFEATASRVGSDEVTAMMTGTTLNSSRSSFALLFTIVKAPANPLLPKAPQEPEGPHQPH